MGLDTRYVPRLDLFRSTSFRLVALYLAVFTLSVLILGAVVYYNVGRQIELENVERVTVEPRTLVALTHARDFSTFIAEVQARSARAGALDYRLEDASGKTLAGDLPPSTRSDNKYQEGWTRVAQPETGADADADTDWDRALATRLDNGALLLVGYGLGGVEDARHAVLTAFEWALAATLGLGTMGGILLSGNFLRRIDEMSAAARGIADGNLKQRIPVSGRNDDIERLAGTFNHMFDRLEALMEANRHVSHDIAHDLRRPLTKIMRTLETARLSSSLDDAKGGMDAAIAEIHVVLDTFNALLRIAQIETGSRRAGFRPLDFAAVAREVAEAFQPAADDDGKRLTIETSTPLQLAGDQELLSQLVANLIDNALRYCPLGASIEVRSEKRAGFSTLIVSDSGPGVPADERKRIFERFYRIDPARTTSGNGLGLSLVSAIAQLHGMEIVVEDNNPGLRIVLRLAPP